MAMPARRATPRTIRPAPCRSRRCPSAHRNTGPSQRYPMARVDRPRGLRRERDHDVLAALADYRQGPVPAFQAQRAGGFRDPQPGQGEQGDQGVHGGRTEPGGDQQGAHLVAAQAGGVRLIVQEGAADMRGRCVVQQLLLDGVLVEPGDGAQPAGDGGGARPAASRSRPKHSMSARRAWNNRNECAAHQAANWRRSSAYASRVSPL